MKKYMVLFILVCFWLLSIMLVLHYDQKKKCEESTAVTDSFEIPVNIRKNVRIFYQEKPFARLTADLVPNRFQGEMLYYLHITAELSLIIQGKREDIVTKGYFLFKSSYELVRFNLDITARYELIKVVGRMGENTIQVTADVKKTGTRIFQIEIPVIIWNSIIKAFLKEKEQLPLKIADDQAVLGDYRLSFEKESVETELVPVNLENLSNISQIIDRNRK